MLFGKEHPRPGLSQSLSNPPALLFSNWFSALAEVGDRLGHCQPVTVPNAHPPTRQLGKRLSGCLQLWEACLDTTELGDSSLAFPHP